MAGGPRASETGRGPGFLNGTPALVRIGALDGGDAQFPGANPDDRVDRRDPHLAVPDLTRAGRVGDDREQRLGLGIRLFRFEGVAGACVRRAGWVARRCRAGGRGPRGWRFLHRSTRKTPTCPTLPSRALT